MTIIRYTKDATIRYAYLNIYPDQFKTEKEKKDEGVIYGSIVYITRIFPIMPRRSEIVYRHIIIS